jgi:two-component system chemotaxis sensor kinase CheA
MDELLEQFLIEGRELTEQANDDLLALERDPTSSSNIDSAFRAVHTLKGSTALFDFAPMTEALHAAEDLLGSLRAKQLLADRTIVSVLLECIAASERWIDCIERTERLPVGAAAQASALRQALLAPLKREDQQTSTPPPDLEWLAPLLAREGQSMAAARGAGRTITALRYVPNSDCFFRGDDPVALVRSVPELLAFRVTPREPWMKEGYDPFACNVVIEALSAASPDDLRRIFRLVPDQVVVIEVGNRIGQFAPNGDVSLMDKSLESGLRTLRVEASRIDTLVDVAGELIVAQNTLAHLAAKARQSDPALAHAMAANHADFERLVANMRSAVMRLRTVPLSTTFRRFPRLVREIADKLGKDVEFVVSGQDVEADKSIVDGLFEPLLHVVRNALDHGIESSAARRSAGKPTTGKVMLQASREAEQIVVTVTDDGAGIDLSAIRKAAEARGLMPEPVLNALQDSAATDLIFAPGISTATQVTDISGRGVGMDAVRTAVELLGGRVDIVSGIGSGTTIRMTLPQTVFVTAVMTVRVGQELYGVPLDVVAETARIPIDRINAIRSGEAFVLRDRTIPLVRLSSILDISTPERSGADVKVLVVSYGNQRVALEVDAFVDRAEVLMRPMAGLLSGMPGVLGTALLGDGRVLIILDVSELIG